MTRTCGFDEHDGVDGSIESRTKSRDAVEPLGTLVIQLQLVVGCRLEVNGSCKSVYPLRHLGHLSRATDT